MTRPPTPTLTLTQLARALSLSAIEADEKAQQALQEEDDIALAIRLSLQESKRAPPRQTVPPPAARVVPASAFMPHPSALQAQPAHAQPAHAFAFPTQAAPLPPAGPDSVSSAAHTHAQSRSLGTSSVRDLPPVPAGPLAFDAPRSRAYLFDEQALSSTSWLAGAPSLAPLRVPPAAAAAPFDSDTHLEAPGPASDAPGEQTFVELSAEQLQALPVAERRQYLAAMRDRLVRHRDAERQARMARFERPVDADGPPLPSAAAAGPATQEADEALEHRRRVAQRLREEVVDRKR
jgi:hypothetical protein